MTLVEFGLVKSGRVINPTLKALRSVTLSLFDATDRIRPIVVQARRRLADVLAEDEVKADLVWPDRVESGKQPQAHADDGEHKSSPARQCRVPPPPLPPLPARRQLAEALTEVAKPFADVRLP